MKYEEYADIAKDVSADNALDVVVNLLSKVKEDSMLYEAHEVEVQERTKKLQDEANEWKAKYAHDMLCGTSTKPEYDDVSEQEKRAQEQQAEIDKILSENMNS